MHITPLKLSGVLLITPKIFQDDRGFFLESYRQPLYATHGIEPSFVQDSLSFSKRGTVRGLHYQKKPGQAKLITCIQGCIWDVAVDIRPDSPTFGQWEAVEIDDQKRQQIFIPIGFAHGFCVLSETALIQYKVSSVYDPINEYAIRWNDPEIGVKWPTKSPILSQRDQTSPFFKEAFHEALGHR